MAGLSGGYPTHGDTFRNEAGQDIVLALPGIKDYTVEVLDTWNMKTLEKSEVKPGLYKYKIRCRIRSWGWLLNVG